MNTAQENSTSTPSLGAAALPTNPPGVTPERLAAILRGAGYRASITVTNGLHEVRSAAQGLNFFVRFGNKAAGHTQFLDFTFLCPLAVEGQMSDGVIELWNRARRFARLGREQQLLVLSMDVLAAGGVPDLYLRAQCELWDALIRGMIVHLRQGGSTPPAPGPEAPADCREPGTGVMRSHQKEWT